MLKVDVQADELRFGLNAIGGKGWKRSKHTLPVLTCVLLDARDGTLRLSFTDLDDLATVTVPATVHGSGRMAVPHKELSALVRGAEAATLTLTQEQEKVKQGRETHTVDRLRIVSGSSATTLLSFAAEEFPLEPKLDQVYQLEVDGRAWRELLDRVVGCASTDESRPVLNGVLCRFRTDWLTAVATNGHRLAQRSLPVSLPAVPDKRRDVIIPHVAVNRALRLLKHASTVTVTIGETHLAVQSNGARITSRLIEGPYPNYEQVIPNNQEWALVADRETLREAVQRCLVVASKVTYRTKWEFQGQTLVISCATPDQGEREERLTVTWDGPAGFVIGMNGSYLVALLDAIPTETVRIRMKHPERAITIEPAEPIDGAFLELLMPLRLID